jgi:hypothetical protein
MVLHPGEHRARHLGLDTEQVNAGARERFLDFINENNDARRINSRQHGPQELLHFIQTAEVIERLAPAPDREAGSLLDHLTVPFPQIIRVELSMNQRHGERLLGCKCAETGQGIHRTAHQAALRLLESCALEGA